MLHALLLASALVFQEEVQEPPSAAPDPGFPTHSIDFALSDESVGLAYAYRFKHGQGALTLGGVGNDDDDFSAYALLFRHGSPTPDSDLDLGLGIGAYSLFFDDEDAEVYAITLGGSAAYTFSLGYPLRVGAQASFAPDVTTFDDGDDLLDLLVRVELAVSEYASAFVGYRRLQADLGDDDEEVDDRVHLGIRLGI